MQLGKGRQAKTKAALKADTHTEAQAHTHTQGVNEGSQVGREQDKKLPGPGLTCSTSSIAGHLSVPLCVCAGERGGAGCWAGNGHVPVMLPLSLSALLGVSRAINLCMQCIKFKLKEPPSSSSSSRILPATSTRFDTLQHWLGSACYQY